MAADSPILKVKKKDCVWDLKRWLQGKELLLLFQRTWV